MHAPRRITLLPLLAPARSASNRRRVNKPLRYFIPPLLLRPGPHFVFAAVNTTERPIDVIAAMDEIRRAVTVIRRQQSLVHRRPEHGPKAHFPLLVAGLNFGILSVDLDLGALLLAAFHFHLAR